jgi:hypothetical protein
MATIALLAAEETMIKALQPFHAVSRAPNATAADPLAVTLRAAREGDVPAAEGAVLKRLMACVLLPVGHAYKAA